MKAFKLNFDIKVNQFRRHAVIFKSCKFTTYNTLLPVHVQKFCSSRSKEVLYLFGTTTTKFLNKVIPDYLR